MLFLLDHRLDRVRVPCVRSVSTVPCPAAEVTLRMFFIDANSMSIGSTLAQIFLGFRLEQLGSRRFLIRAVGLSSIAIAG